MQNCQFTLWGNHCGILNAKSGFASESSGSRMIFSVWAGTMGSTVDFSLAPPFFPEPLGRHWSEPLPPLACSLHSHRCKESKHRHRQKGWKPSQWSEWSATAWQNDNGDVDLTVTYLRTRWRLMESFERHFICLETVWVITSPLLPLPPAAVWMGPGQTGWEDGFLRCPTPLAGQGPQD